MKYSKTQVTPLKDRFVKEVKAFGLKVKDNYKNTNYKRK